MSRALRDVETLRSWRLTRMSEATMALMLGRSLAWTRARLAEIAAEAASGAAVAVEETGAAELAPRLGDGGGGQSAQPAAGVEQGQRPALGLARTVGDVEPQIEPQGAEPDLGPAGGQARDDGAKGIGIGHAPSLPPRATAVQTNGVRRLPDTMPVAWRPARPAPSIRPFTREVRAAELAFEPRPVRRKPVGRNVVRWAGWFLVAGWSVEETAELFDVDADELGDVLDRRVAA